MTNKEAVRKLTDTKIYFCRTGNTNAKTELIEAFDLAIKALENRPQGEWVLDCYSTFDEDWYKCSICGRLIHINKKQLYDYPFCHCGADMRGGKKA